MHAGATIGGRRRRVIPVAAGGAAHSAPDGRAVGRPVVDLEVAFNGRLEAINLDMGLIRQLDGIAELVCTPDSHSFANQGPCVATLSIYLRF